MNKIKQHFMWAEYKRLLKRATYVEKEIEYHCQRWDELRAEINGIRIKLTMLDADVRNAIRDIHEDGEEE